MAKKKNEERMYLDFYSLIYIDNLISLILKVLYDKTIRKKKEKVKQIAFFGLYSPLFIDGDERKFYLSAST